MDTLNDKSYIYVCCELTGDEKRENKIVSKRAFEQFHVYKLFSLQCNRKRNKSKRKELNGMCNRKTRSKCKIKQKVLTK